MTFQERRNAARRTGEDRRKSGMGLINSYLEDDFPSRRSGAERRTEPDRRKNTYH